MRKSLLLSATILGLVAGAAVAPGAYAQVGSTQTPPSPNASSQPPQPMNSVPPGAATSSSRTPGGAIATTGAGAVPPPATVTAGRPMRNAPRYRRTGNNYVPPIASGEPSDPNAPPTAAYRGGAGSPSSTVATNLTPSNRLGARLPEPTVPNTPEALLAAAQRDLRAGRTGAAQEALERAETRVLSRTTDPSLATAPDQAAMVQNIGAARRALGARDTRGAMQAIDAALQAPVPRPGPAVVPAPRY